MTENIPEPPLIISYFRFSSMDQLSGDSLSRQTRLSEKWCQKRGWTLSERKFTDQGRSGFHGDHLRGDFGSFLRLVDSGKIPLGSLLLVENLDRLSRQKPWRSIGLISSILEKGVNIQTLTPEKTYTKDSSNEDILFMIFGLMGSHTESLKKSERLGSLWEEKRKKLKNNQMVRLTRLPSWLKQNPNSLKVQPIPEKVKTVQLIFKLFTEKGYSQERIVRYLNTNGVSPIGKKDVWYISYIKKLLKDPSVTGHRSFCKIEVNNETGQRKRVPQTELLKVYPSIISEEVFQQSLSRHGTTNHRGRIGGVNLFSTKIVKCGRCGSKMVVNGKGGGYKRLICFSYFTRSGCSCSPGYNLDEFEKSFFNYVKELKISDIFNNETHDFLVQTKREEQSQLLNEIKKNKKKLKNLTDVMMDDSLSFSETLKKEFLNLEDSVKSSEIRVKKLEEELDGLGNQSDSGTILSLSEYYLKNQPFTDLEQRKLIREVINEQVEEIRVFSYRNFEDLDVFKDEKDWLKFLKRNRLDTNQQYQKKLRCFFIKFRFKDGWRLVRGIEKYFKNPTVVIDEPKIFNRIPGSVKISS